MGPAPFRRPSKAPILRTSQALRRLILATCLAAAAAQAASVGDGLARLRATAFPGLQTVEPGRFTWVGDALGTRPSGFSPFDGPAWLLNATPASATLLLPDFTPVDVRFTADPLDPRPQIRWEKGDPAEAAAALTTRAQAANTDNGEVLGHALLAATLLDAAGQPDAARHLAEEVFSRAESPEVPVAWALNLAGNSQYGAALERFRQTGDIAAFYQQAAKLVQRFRGAWPLRTTVAALVERIGTTPPLAELRIQDGVDEESADLLRDIVRYAPDTAELARLAQFQRQPWILMDPPPANESSPLTRLLAKGPAAIPVLSAVCDAMVWTRYTGSASGNFQNLALTHFSPTQEGPGNTNANLALVLPHPLTLGELSRFLLLAAIQTGTPNSALIDDPAAVRSLAAAWMLRHGALRGSALLKAVLAEAPHDRHDQILQGPIQSADPAWIPFFEEYFSAQPVSLANLVLVSQIVQRHRAAAAAIAKNFLARLGSPDDLLPDYAREGNFNPDQLDFLRRQIKKQIETLRDAAAPPSTSP